jgi:hypothetical protein
MKKPGSEIRSAPHHAKIGPRFKKMAEKMASDDDSLQSRTYAPAAIVMLVDDARNLALCGIVSPK